MSQIPLLIFSFYLLLGCAASLSHSLLYPLLLLPLFFWCKRGIIGSFLFIIGAAYGAICAPSPSTPSSIEGKGVFRLSSITPSSSPFRSSICLKGKFDRFEGEEKKLRSVPCLIFIDQIPAKGTRWEIEGVLKERVFKPKKGVDWREIENRFSLIRWRFAQKEKLRAHIKQRVNSEKVAQLFCALTTGHLSDRLLAIEMRTVGLGHILAISGFHFAVIASLFGTLLHVFLPRYVAKLSLLCFLSALFVFLGPAPSILRAFVMIFLYLLAPLLGRRSHSLNLIGCALLIELLYDPLSIQEVGFQLTFLATLSIVLFYSPCTTLLEKLFPRRPFALLKEMSRLDQHVYLVCHFLRKSCSLNLSVYILTLLPTLYHFKSFPLLAIPYNILITPLLSLSIAFLPFGLLIPSIQQINASYTYWILKLISHPPPFCNYTLHTPPIPLWVVLCSISAALLYRLTKRGVPRENWGSQWRS